MIVMAAPMVMAVPALYQLQPLVPLKIKDICRAAKAMMTARMMDSQTPSGE